MTELEIESRADRQRGVEGAQFLPLLPLIGALVDGGGYGYDGLVADPGCTEDEGEVGALVRIVCWNIARRSKPWKELLRMGADVALLQEVNLGDVPSAIEVSGDTPPANDAYDRWPVVARLSDAVEVEWFRPVHPTCRTVEATDIAVSDLFTIAAARVIPLSGQHATTEPFVVVSMYAPWLSPHPLAKRSVPPMRGTERIDIYSDASAHRIISDLAAFIGHTNPASHRILAAGDLNTIYGATEENRLEMRERMLTVFDRMAALGLEFLGPQWPAAARQASPFPQGLPEDTKNVPTYCTPKQNKATVQNQLDYVFASRGFHQSVRAHAMNGEDEWGPSDHCRIWIEVQ